MKKSDPLKLIFLGFLVTAFACIVMFGVTLRQKVAGQQALARQPRPSPLGPRTPQAVPSRAQQSMPPRAQQEATQPVMQSVAKEAAIPFPPPGAVFGKWAAAGLSLSRNLGVRGLTLEITPPSADRSQITGYATFTNFPLQPPAGIGRPGPNAATLIAQSMPRSAIMTGIPSDGGSIHFSVDKLIGFTNDCPLTELTITPFGTAQLAAEWKNGDCSADQMMLSKVPR